MSQAKQLPKVGACQRCRSTPRETSVTYAGGVFLEFACPTCKLRASWTYEGPPAISIWFDQRYLDEANEYLALARQWRKSAFGYQESSDGSAWNGSPPPLPTKDLFAVCIDFNYQQVVLRPRAAQLGSDTQPPAQLAETQAAHHATPADAQ